MSIQLRRFSHRDGRSRSCHQNYLRRVKPVFPAFIFMSFSFPAADPRRLSSRELRAITAHGAPILSLAWCPSDRFSSRRRPHAHGIHKNKFCSGRSQFGPPSWCRRPLRGASVRPNAPRAPALAPLRTRTREHLAGRLSLSLSRARAQTTGHARRHALHAAACCCRRPWTARPC